MYRPNKFQAYQNGAVFTASPAQLILMLFEGAVRFINISLEGFNHQDPLEFNLTINQNVQKAQAIIRELKACLHEGKSPEFAQRMTALYDYFDRRLQEGNLKKTREPIEEVLRHLHVLRDAWKEMTLRQSQAGASALTPASAEAVGQWSATS